MLWGIATACTASATSLRGLIIARVFLGIFEVMHIYVSDVMHG